jgi:glycyl-tRNA synthetase
MENLYDSNGLVFWTEEEIRLRSMFEKYFVQCLKRNLKSQNRAFDFYKCEAPLLTPTELINPNYTEEDVFVQQDVVRRDTMILTLEGGTPQKILVLRPETTMGSYAYARHLLNPHNASKVMPPLVIYQHGKSFRREQDQPTKFMRLKEFYQLEFQILYSPSTKNDYSISLIPAVCKMIEDMIGTCHVEDSDRIPSYAEWTKDVICDKSGMEVCSIYKRTDYENMNVIEVAIGTDRVIYNFNQKNEKNG